MGVIDTQHRPTQSVMLRNCCYQTASNTGAVLKRMQLYTGNWLRYKVCWQSVWQCTGHNTVQQGEVGLGSIYITNIANEWPVSTANSAAICAYTERD
jgi:hypothetical protein